jgi:hypothetical protein
VAPAPSTVIKLKRGTTTPTSGNIESGEVAVDTSAQKLYINDNGVIKEIGGSGATDLTNITTNLVPTTDTSVSIGTLQKAFTDIFYSNNVKQQVDIFTNSGGLATAAAHFTFRPNISKTYFTEVYTNSGGLSTPALTAPTAFDDNNPAYRF